MYNVGVKNVIFPSRLLKWRCDDDYDVSSLFFKQLPAFHTLHCEMKNKTRSHDLTLTKHYDLVIDLNSTILVESNFSRTLNCVTTTKHTSTG